MNIFNSMADKIRQGIRTWLRIQPAQIGSIQLNEVLDYEANAIKNRMTIIKRKTFIIKHFARIAEQTDLQKKTKYCDVSVTRLLAACFGNDGR